MIQYDYNNQGSKESGGTDNNAEQRESRKETLQKAQRKNGEELKKYDGERMRHYENPEDKANNHLLDKKTRKDEHSKPVTDPEAGTMKLGKPRSRIANPNGKIN